MAHTLTFVGSATNYSLVKSGRFRVLTVDGVEGDFACGRDLEPNPITGCHERPRWYIYKRVPSEGGGSEWVRQSTWSWFETANGALGTMAMMQRHRDTVLAQATQQVAA